MKFNNLFIEIYIYVMNEIKKNSIFQSKIKEKKNQKKEKNMKTYISTHYMKQKRNQSDKRKEEKKPFLDFRQF